MTNREIMSGRIDAEEKTILEIERHIWKNPESGYREWKTHAYLKEKFENLGYKVYEAGNIPGFWCEIDTGREGPCVGVFGELDSLIIPTHPEADPVTGAVHACGHNCQCAALYGIAAALKAPGALDGLCGKIRLFAVPNEEIVEIDYFEKLKAEGVIRFFSGKLEFMARGYLDDLDMAMMIHTASQKALYCIDGSNGCILKRAVFRGKACHASAPYNGHNALYAANAAINAANALRETFRDEDCIRFHPIIESGGSAVNSIPDEVTVVSGLRGKTIPAMAKANRQMNRAFAAAAAAMECELEIKDRHGDAPRYHDANMQRVFEREGKAFFPAEAVTIHKGFAKSCSDFGDISAVMPAIHPHIGGAEGPAHSAEYYIVDPYMACVLSAKVQAAMLAGLLENDAAEAKKVMEEAKAPYSIGEYLEVAEKDEFCGEAVTYKEDGTVVLHFAN